MAAGAGTVGTIHERIRRRGRELLACYAWPISYEGTGKRAFFVNQSGQILVCSNQRTHYSGTGNFPPRNAALAPGSPITMNGRLAINMIGYDGNFWRVLN